MNRRDLASFVEIRKLVAEGAKEEEREGRFSFITDDAADDLKYK